MTSSFYAGKSASDLFAGDTDTNGNTETVFQLPRIIVPSFDTVHPAFADIGPAAP